MKIQILCSVMLLSVAFASAQGGAKKGTEKVVEKSQKLNEKSKEISDASNEVANQVAQTGNNVKNTVNNVKAIIKVLEPIWAFHFKKKKRTAADGTQTVSQPGNDAGVQQSADQQTVSSSGSMEVISDPNTYPSNGNPIPYETGVPESDTYNSDGTMNMGHQNNGRFGNCLNLLEGVVMGVGEAEDASGKIDLIFYSQFGGLGYSFQSPFEAPGINEGVDIKSWRERNETEIAETKLSIAQFEKITGNAALVSAVKSTRGFAGYFFTPNKMDGRVFAVKVQQDNKEIYALLAVYKQYGTGGSNGYLKIKIKVQGIDKNADGRYDYQSYQRN